MPYVDKHKSPFCDEFPTDCSFERKNYLAGATVHNEDTNINYLIFFHPMTDEQVPLRSLVLTHYRKMMKRAENIK